PPADQGGAGGDRHRAAGEQRGHRGRGAGGGRGAVREARRASGLVLSPPARLPGRPQPGAAVLSLTVAISQGRRPRAAVPSCTSRDAPGRPRRSVRTASVNGPRSTAVTGSSRSATTLVSVQPSRARSEVMATPSPAISTPARDGGAAAAAGPYPTAVSRSCRYASAARKTPAPGRSPAYGMIAKPAERSPRHWARGVGSCGPAGWSR